MIILWHIFLESFFLFLPIIAFTLSIFQVHFKTYLARGHLISLSLPKMSENDSRLSCGRDDLAPLNKVVSN